MNLNLNSKELKNLISAINLLKEKEGLTNSEEKLLKK